MKHPFKGHAPWLALIVLILVGFSVTTKITDTSPGPLSAVHALVDELRGPNACDVCHGTEKTSMDQACGECHEHTRAELASSKGFHGTLPKSDQKDCGRCHIEHLDAATEIVGNRAFRKSGFSQRDRYKHEKLDYRLEGRHVDLACKECHELADIKVLPKNKQRFTGLKQTCKSCHEDPHEGKAPDCAGCHGQQRPFKEVALFEHDRRFPLTGGHAGITCRECHADGDYSHYLAAPDSSSKERRSKTGSQPKPLRTCQACHESPHSTGFLEGVAKLGNKTPETSCELCHEPADESLARPVLEKTLAFHSVSGFSLVKPHAEVACVACHKEPPEDWKQDLLAQYKPRFPGRKAEECAHCHGDPHEGQFKTKGVPQPDCLSCHKLQRFLPHGFDLARHAKTNFPLHGAHVKLACEKCHESKPGQVDPDRYPKVRQFKGTTKECKDCHESPHAGQFDGGFFEADNCLACHDDERFFPSLFTAEMHDRTDFPLLGAHRAIACRDCHKVAEGTRPPGKKKNSPEIAGRLFHGREKACKACHVDVHDGGFDKPGLPKSVDGKESCLRCHGHESFAMEPTRPFRHGFWTGYKLEGAHAKARCQDCHIPRKEGGSLTHAFGKAKKNCVECHDTPHMGQFRVRGYTDCERCHEPDLEWKAKKFSHDEDSRFKLGKDHSSLACSKCHRDYELPGGRKVVRYKPLGIECKDCHLWSGKR